MLPTTTNKNKNIQHQQYIYVHFIFNTNLQLCNSVEGTHDITSISLYTDTYISMSCLKQMYFPEHPNGLTELNGKWEVKSFEQRSLVLFSLHVVTS